MTLEWDLDAQAAAGAQWCRTEPVLVQISAAKRLRDRAERDAAQAGEVRVNAAARGGFGRRAAQRGGGMNRAISVREPDACLAVRIDRRWHIRRSCPHRAGFARQRAARPFA
jgi:hypothetical protein